MNDTQFRDEFQAARNMRDGHVKAERLEALAARAVQEGDPLLEAQVLLALGYALGYAAEQDKLPVAAGRMLQLLDKFPDAVGPVTSSIHWQLKWVTTSLLTNPDVPLAVSYRWLDELESRYRQRGYSLRPALIQRALLALELGEAAAASELMESSAVADRDEMADCLACERNDFGRWRAALGDDEGALSYWQPVLDGKNGCAEEPHRVLGHALLPLLRTGRAQEARGAFRRGYSLARNDISLIATVGKHLEFCALTGNEARGLEILAEHAAWLASRQVDAVARLDFVSGVTVLLRRLALLGHGPVPVGAAGTVESLLAAMEQEIAQICARYDARNGNSAVSDAVAARLRREPLTDRLPLEATSPDELVGQARELTELRHPRAGEAWERAAAAVTAAGEPSARLAAELARARAETLLRTDPAAAHAALLDVVAQFEDIDLSRWLEARAAAAYALSRASGNEEDQARARAEADAVREEADEAWEDGALDLHWYLTIQVTGQMIACQVLATAAQRPADELAKLSAGLESVRADAFDQGHPSHEGQCQLMLAQVASWQGDADGEAALLQAARESFLHAGTPWFAVGAEARLADLALQSGDARQAEAYARDGLNHAVDPSPQQAARLASLRASALSQLS